MDNHFLVFIEISTLNLVKCYFLVTVIHRFFEIMEHDLQKTSEMRIFSLFPCSFLFRTSRKWNFQIYENSLCHDGTSQVLITHNADPFSQACLTLYRQNRNIVTKKDYILLVRKLTYQIDFLAV